MEIFNKKNKIKKLKNHIKDSFKKVPRTFLTLILAITILISSLLSNKIVWGHDYIFHATNNILTNNHIDIFKLNFFLPKVFGGSIANGFGYGTGIFYPPLSYYLTSYISYFLNLSSTNTVLSLSYLQILIIVLSGITMYMFTNRISKDKYIAMISSISYICSTYFICNIYARSALAESLISIFIPLVFWGLYELFFRDEKKFTLLFTIGYVGMINSHLVLSVFITIIIIIIFIIYFKKVFKKDKLIKLIKASILVLLISSPFLIGVLEHKFFGSYTVFEENTMYTIESIKEHALNITDFFIIRHKTDNGIEVYLNYVTLMASILTIAFNKTIFKKDNRDIYKISLIIVIISIFISTKYFPWEHMPSFIKMLQFPWRMCGIASFGLAILSGYIVKIIDADYKKIAAYIISILILFFGYSTIPKENLYLYDIVIPKQMHMGVQNEYLPSSTNNNINYFKTRNQDIAIKEGFADIQTIENNTPYLKSEITLNSNKLIIELPRIYYLGYEIFLYDTEGNKNKIKYYENKYGFIELELNKSGTLEIDYTGTLLNKIANYISLGTIIISILTLFIQKYKKRIN